MYYYDLGDHQVVGSSPGDPGAPEGTNSEGGETITIRPIAGIASTQGWPPSKTPATKRAAGRSQRKRAEHVMLIDLARNDIGRIAKTGSVKSPGPLASSATHVNIVSNVEGRSKMA